MGSIPVITLVIPHRTSWVSDPTSNKKTCVPGCSYVDCYKHTHYSVFIHANMQMYGCKCMGIGENLESWSPEPFPDSRIHVFFVLFLVVSLSMQFQLFSKHFQALCCIFQHFQCSSNIDKHFMQF